MNKFFQLFVVIMKHARINFLSHVIQFAPLSYTWLISFFSLIVIGRYAGFSYIPSHSMADAWWFSILFMIVDGSLFFLWIFLDTTIATFFLKNETGLMNSRRVFYMMSLSCYPYLFIAPLCILWNALLGTSGYIWVCAFCFVWSMKVRFNWLSQYQHDFRIWPSGVLFLPLLIEFSFIVSLLAMFSLSLWLRVANFLDELNFFLYS